MISDDDILKQRNCNWNFGTIRNKTFVSVVLLLYRNREFRCFFNRKFRVFFLFFLFFSFFCLFVFFGLFRNSLFWLFHFYAETESFYVSIEPKQTEDPPKQFKRENIWLFFRKCRVVSVCYGTNITKQFFYLKQMILLGNKLKFLFWFHETK